MVSIEKTVEALNSSPYRSTWISIRQNFHELKKKTLVARFCYKSVRCYCGVGRNTRKVTEIPG